MIKDFLWNNRFIIVLLIAVVLYALMEWQRFKATAYSLMLQAKRMAKDAILKSGQVQEEWVVRKVYQFLPRRLTILITEQMMRQLVHYMYHKAKDYLDDGKENNSIE